MSLAEKFIRFESEAIGFVRSKANALKLKTAILDDWSGIRLIYETEDVLRCSNACETCDTYKFLGQDHGQAGDFLRTTLVRSSAEHTDVPRNRMLNCKTKSDYMQSFSEWLVRRCETADDFYDELVLIRDFRVVFSDACKDGDELLILEHEMKRGIIRSAMERIHGERKAIFQSVVGRVFAGALDDACPFSILRPCFCAG